MFKKIITELVKNKIYLKKIMLERVIKSIIKKKNVLIKRSNVLLITLNILTK